MLGLVRGGCGRSIALVRGSNVLKFTAIMAVRSSTTPKVMNDRSLFPRAPISTHVVATIRLRIMAIAHALRRVSDVETHRKAV